MSTEAAKTAVRTYAVREQTVDSAGKVTIKETRLVKASNPARALKHVVTPRFTVQVAEMDDVVEIIKTGGSVELATTEE